MVPIVRYIPILEIMKNEKIFIFRIIEIVAGTQPAHMCSLSSILKWGKKRMVYGAGIKSLMCE